jgi:hypothetical protein
MLQYLRTLLKIWNKHYYNLSNTNMKSIKLIALLTATSLLSGCIAPTRNVYVYDTPAITPIYIVRPAPIYWNLHMGWYSHNYHRRGPWRR